MKSYTERRGFQPFDWNALFDKEKISDNELYEAVEASKCWVTCACGQQCDIIPRTVGPDMGDDGRPVDDKLASLGIEFTSAMIKWKNSKRVAAKRHAKDILKKIEARSAKLIKEINEQKEGGH